MKEDRFMKKTVLNTLLIFLIAVLLSGCMGEKAPDNDSEKIDIVCTAFPVYDWITEIIGDEAEHFSVTLLGGEGDLHSFQPTAKDISKIHQCDLFVGVGSAAEQWIEKIEKAPNSSWVSLFEMLDEDELLALNNEKDEHHHHDTHSDFEYDEHVWLSLRLAEKMVNGICDEISKLDTQNGVIYKVNAARYCDELRSLDSEYRTEVGKFNDKTVIFADRFPFAYMMKDYDISVIAAFAGCSADDDASFEKVAKVCEAVKSKGKDTVLILENSAETVVTAINAALGEDAACTAVMNSCQTIRKEKKDTDDYLEIMRENLISLKKALE